MYEKSIRPMKVFKSSDFKINLQHHNGLFPEGHTGVNPLLADPEPAAPAEPVDTTGGGGAPVDDPAPDSTPAEPDPSPQASPAPGFDISQLIEGVKEAVVQGNQSVLDGIQNLNKPDEPAADPEPTGPTQEEIDAFNEEWREKLYDNPYELMQEMQKIAAENADAKVQPILDQQQKEQMRTKVEQEVATFISEHEDFHDHADLMVEFFTKYPDLRNMEGVTELAYNYARGTQYSAPPTLDDFVGQEGNIEKLSANEKIQELVVQNYLKGIKDGQPPSSFGGKGGAPAPTPTERPKTLAEATALMNATYASKGH